jgi:hypothetical protein
MMEHNPWRGPDYQTGINRQRIAVVGYSQLRVIPSSRKQDQQTTCLAELFPHVGQTKLTG